MTSLFIDTTKYITIGLLDEDFKWVAYKHYKELKASAAIHFKIAEMLEDNSLSVDSLKSVFHVAGAGSYTGMRVSTGMAQVFNFAKKKVYSFYHHEVPSLLKVKEGMWASEAFKNELFVYRWKEEGSSKDLISKDDFLEKTFYSSFDRDPKESTSQMIYNQSESLFNKVKELNMQKEIFYYRSLDQEFGRES